MYRDVHVTVTVRIDTAGAVANCICILRQRTYRKPQSTAQCKSNLSCESVATRLRAKGGQIVLSLELFNPNYYAMDPNYVAKTGLEKMKRFF